MRQDPVKVRSRNVLLCFQSKRFSIWNSLSSMEDQAGEGVDKFNLLKREREREEGKSRRNEGERSDRRRKGDGFKIARFCPKTRFATVRRNSKGCQVAGWRIHSRYHCPSPSLRLATLRGGKGIQKVLFAALEERVAALP